MVVVLSVSIHHPSLFLSSFFWVRISKLINNGWWGGAGLGEMVWKIKQTLDCSDFCHFMLMFFLPRKPDIWRVYSHTLSHTIPPTPHLNWVAKQTNKWLLRLGKTGGKQRFWERNSRERKGHQNLWSIRECQLSVDDELWPEIDFQETCV